MKRYDIDVNYDYRESESPYGAWVRYDDPELQEMMEKAEQLSTLMHGLKVRERCKYCKYGIGDFLDNCTTCHGTGTITREATPEEVRESLNYPESNGYYLKSGGVLFMEVQKCLK